VARYAGDELAGTSGFAVMHDLANAIGKLGGEPAMKALTCMVVGAPDAPVRAVPSPDDVVRGMTPKGAWTRKQLAEWGVSWPPPKGWRKCLEEQWESGGAGRVMTPLSAGVHGIMQRTPPQDSGTAPVDSIPYRV
jgi:hypothetical protein